MQTLLSANQSARAILVILKIFLIQHISETQVLSLNQEDLLNVTSGWIINLVAGDLQRFEHSALSIFLLPQAVLEVCSISCLMVYFFGWKPLSGVAFMVSLALY